MAKIKAPSDLKARLKAVGKEHKLGSVDEVVAHFLIRGLKQYDDSVDASDYLTKIDAVVDAEGYSSVDELVEHLLLRGLEAYEAPEQDAEKLAQRLRGLGYID